VGHFETLTQKKVGAQSDFLYKNGQQQIQTYAFFFSVSASQIDLPFFFFGANSNIPQPE
jgi:hypothetical protein